MKFKNSIMNGKIKFIFVLLYIFLFPISAHANGGIPLWVTSIHAIAAASVTTTSGIVHFNSSSLIFTLICLYLVIYCEAIFLKKKYFKNTPPKKIIKIVTFSNLISTILGGILILICYYAVYEANKENYPILEALIFDGPFITMLQPSTSVLGIIYWTLTNVFFCIFSYAVEYPITKKYLQNEYSKNIISKGVLISNILSYFAFLFIILPSVYLIILLLFPN